MAFAAAERRETPRRETILQVGEVVRAQRDIIGKIENPRRIGLLRIDSPRASELGGLVLDVLAQRFHLGEKGAQFFQVASEFSSHERRFA